MEDVERNLPYICYAMAIAKAALHLVRGGEVELQSNFERYYNDYVNTNIFMSVMVHPLYILIMLPLRFHYTGFDRAMRKIRERSDDNALSLGVLLNTFNLLTTWGIVYAVAALVFSTASSSMSDIFVSILSGLGVAAGSSLLVHLLGATVPREERFVWYNLGVHLLCLLCAGVPLWFKNKLPQAPAVVWATLMVIGGHALGYTFMRLATARFSSRQDRGLSLVVHGLFSAGSLALRRD